MALDLDSTSTFAEILAAYDNNADYDLVGSVTKAKDFIQACRFLLLHKNDEGEHGRAIFRNDAMKLREQLAQAETWWRSNDTDALAAQKGHVRHFALREFRG
jgi:hypothetical protein